MPNIESIEKAFTVAKDQYAALGVDVEVALERLATVPISLHCWQGDDVGGFESDAGELDGGIAVTGNYPGKARTHGELRMDLEKALSLIPGTHRLNLHACYGEFDGQKADRNELETKHFQGWIDWAKSQNMGMDFNPTFFSHPKAADGMTLSHADESIRKFWVEHAICCRKIGAEMGRQLGSPTVTNVWIPDGMKDTPVDRIGPRERLRKSLDETFAESLDPAHNLDAVECKLFGIGSESYVVGSHEFYIGYAVKNNKLLCLDAGHFHPTEVISDKLSSALLFVDRLLLHVSRGVRWDSDHVVTLTDELQAIGQELVRGDMLSRVHIGLDFFDASINRIAAWTIGTRAMIKSLLMAMLEPIDELRRLENDGDFAGRLAMLEESKSLPHGSVWNYYCMKSETPADGDWMPVVRQYEADVLSKR